MTPAETVFQPARIGSIRLRNRIIRSATHEGMAAPDGSPEPDLQKLYLRLAKGQAGAIITGYAGIQQDGKSPLFAMSMIDSDDKIQPFKRIVDAVHAHNTPIIMQIAHCGRQTRSAVTGRPTVAPSAIADKFYNEDVPLELSDTAIETIIDNFTAAIVRARNAGFDAVQLHLAHGYLLAQFLSSYSNRRKDRWGGTTSGKYRIVEEIFNRAKKKAGDFPILAKINAHDSRKNGMRVREAVSIARHLEASGCCAVEVSCGVFEDGLYTVRGETLPAKAALAHTFKYKRLPGPLKKMAAPILPRLIKQPKPLLAYNLEAALAIKQAVTIPVIVVGGINNLADIDTIINSHNMDFVSMSRPFIIEPDIVEKFKQGRQTRSKCIMCNYCAVIGEEKPLRCHYGKLPKA